MGDSSALGRVAITEALQIDLGTETWHCRRCDRALGPARQNYKEGCLVAPRDPSTLYPPYAEGERYSFAPDPALCQLVEFYCPGCGCLIETEALPPGHPPTFDIEIDLDSLRQRQTP
jgi:acetone carboxylase gamma subunit